ncbi:hypothetical protein F5I97DRAFT_1800284 [Phlebopus sp. FC_14]|nr:hypothetical protein F5I97DRAFT_1800284 [Phlebopus sp. FC_14]
MSNGIEMHDLSQSGRKSASTGDSAGDPGGGGDEPVDKTTSIWAWTSATILAIFSLCLVTFPRFLLFLAETSGGRGTLTSLERYLALQLGIIFGAIAATIISAIPNESPLALRPRENSHPLLAPVTAASLTIAFLSYNSRSVGTLATAVFLGSGLIGLFGLWMLVFANSSSISRKTGADKHTSSFIFGNKSAASVKKRLWKRNQAHKKNAI